MVPRPGNVSAVGGVPLAPPRALAYAAGRLVARCCYALALPPCASRSYAASSAACTASMPLGAL